jgi:hypothetical protein
LTNVEIKCESLQLQLDEIKELMNTSRNQGQSSQHANSTIATYKALFDSEANAVINVSIIFCVQLW